MTVTATSLPKSMTQFAFQNVKEGIREEKSLLVRIGRAIGGAMVLLISLPLDIVFCPLSFVARKLTIKKEGTPPNDPLAAAQKAEKAAKEAFTAEQAKGEAATAHAAKLEAELETAKRDHGANDQLVKQAHAKSKELKAVQTKLQLAEENQAETAERLAAAEKRIASLDEDLKRAEADAEAAESREAEHLQAKGEAEGELDAAQKEIDLLREELAAAKTAAEEASSGDEGSSSSASSGDDEGGSALNGEGRSSAAEEDPKVDFEGEGVLTAALLASARTRKGLGIKKTSHPPVEVTRTPSPDVPSQRSFASAAFAPGSELHPDAPTS